LLALLGFLPIGVGFYVGIGNITILAISLGVAIVYWMGLSLIQSTLSSIFQTALYLYVKEGEALQGFPTDLLEQAYQVKTR
ncbi:MAG: hypothetical protein ACAI44_19330, partial [Candidatus Sericytochromatia bacterium]